MGLLPKGVDYFCLISSGFPFFVLFGAFDVVTHLLLLLSLFISPCFCVCVFHFLSFPLYVILGVVKRNVEILMILLLVFVSWTNGWTNFIINSLIKAERLGWCGFYSFLCRDIFCLSLLLITTGLVFGLTDCLRYGGRELNIGKGVRMITCCRFCWNCR